MVDFPDIPASVLQPGSDTAPGAFELVSFIETTLLIFVSDTVRLSKFRQANDRADALRQAQDFGKLC